MKRRDLESVRIQRSVDLSYRLDLLDLDIRALEEHAQQAGIDCGIELRGKRQARDRLAREVGL